MSDDNTDDAQKTEEPTAKRLQEARKEGQVAQSREINNWIILSVGTFVLFGLGPNMMQEYLALFRVYIAAPHTLSASPDGIYELLSNLVAESAKLLVLPAILLMVAALASTMLQVGLLVSTESIKPKLSKISPISGFGRLFSVKSIVEFLKSIFKMTIISGVATLLMIPYYGSIEHFVGLDITVTLSELYDILIRLIIGILSILTIIAIVDYIFQKMEHMKKLRMSRQEIKDEYKQSEGDPHVKARLAELRQTKARQRMMQSVPESDVIITNPTHYAIALKYNPEQMDAPVMVAKGADAVAHRIKELGKEHNITMVENPTLARGLFENMEVNDMIPGEFFKAVAEVISYVFKLKGKKM